MRNRRWVRGTVVVGLLAAGCSADEPTASSSEPVMAARAALTGVTVQPLGAVAAGEPIRLRVLSQDGFALHETWRIWLDLDGNRAFADDELVGQASVGPEELELVLDPRQQAALHGVEPRTVAIRIAMAEDAAQVVDVSIVAEGRPLAVRPIRLGSGTIVTDAPSLDVVAGQHHLVQFRRLPTRDERHVLETQGIALLDYLPERSFWARVSASAAQAASIETAGGVVLAKPALAALKVAAELATGEATDATVTVAVHFFSDATPEEIAAARAVLGDARLDGNHAIVTLPLERISQLAELEAVQWIEPSTTTPTVHSSAGNTDHQISGLHYDGLDGAGVNVAIFDAGWVDASHPDLAGRVFYDPTLPARPSGAPVGNLTTVGAHATHMAGVIASSGVGNAAAKGTAPAATIFSYREAYRYLSINELVANESAAHGWRVINHSYGNGFPCSGPGTEPCKSSPLWTSYIQDARDADTWAYESGVLSVYSAGNDGLVKKWLTVPGWENDNWQTIYSGAAAKNVIATCAASPLTVQGQRFSIKLDSSKGPASDGRVKPDLCAEGEVRSGSGTVWTTDLNAGYRSTQATSPAAAQVTGIVALLQQDYRQRHGGAELPPALAKGVLIHTALDMDEDNSYRSNNGLFESKTFPGPDYTTGWGFPDAYAAVQLLHTPSSIRSESLDDGSVREFDTSLAANAAMKVTLIWTDPPATVGAARALVNDLDVRVTNLSTGEESYPWILDKDSPMEPAKRGINTVDNVEQITLKNASSSAQAYRISVRATSVPKGPQPFFLLSTSPLGIVLYGTSATYTGELGGRSGADFSCRWNKPAACANTSNMRAVISISTEDEMRDMQGLYGIPAATPVFGSKGFPLADSWESLWGKPLANSLETATNLPAGSTYWSGSGANGAAATSSATPGSQYLCSNFTSGTSGFRAPYGASHLTTPAAQYALGWDGGNVYPHCSRPQHLLCACW